MITQTQAFEAVAGVRKIQDIEHGTHPHTVAEWILITERQLQKAKDAWNGGGPRAEDNALEFLAHVAACGVCALEQNVNSKRHE